MPRWWWEASRGWRPRHWGGGQRMTECGCQDSLIQLRSSKRAERSVASPLLEQQQCGEWKPSYNCSVSEVFAVEHWTISFVTWSKKYEWAVMGLQTIRLGLALFQRISGPFAELQIIKSTIERNLWGYFRDTKQTWGDVSHNVTPSSSNYPPAFQFEGESKIMIWSLFYWLVFSHIIFGQKRARNFYRTSIIIVRKIYRPFLSFPVVVSFSMFASLDYLVVLAHLFQANVLGLLGFCYLVNKDRKLHSWDIFVTWPSYHKRNFKNLFQHLLNAEHKMQG